MLTIFFVQSFYNFYSSFKRSQTRHRSLQTTFECSKVFRLKRGEQRQPRTHNSPTVTLCGELSCAHTLLYIWHLDSVTLCVSYGPESVSGGGRCICVYTYAWLECMYTLYTYTFFRGWAVLQTTTSSRQSVFVSLTSSGKSVAWLECVCMPFITFNLIGTPGLFYPWGEKPPGNYGSSGSEMLVKPSEVCVTGIHRNVSFSRSSYILES